MMARRSHLHFSVKSRTQLYADDDLRKLRVPLKTKNGEGNFPNDDKIWLQNCSLVFQLPEFLNWLVGVNRREK